MKRLSATVHGHVQGVAFRANTQAEAGRLGLTGWVKNHWDGSVKLVAEGPDSALHRLAAWLEHGPRARTRRARRHAVVRRRRRIPRLLDSALTTFHSSGEPGRIRGGCQSEPEHLIVGQRCVCRPALARQRNIDCPVEECDTMQLSKFGEKFVGDSGILRLMEDLGRAAQQEGVIMLGGGNPSHIPQVEEVFRARLERILDSESDLERLIGEYGGPAGHQPFIDALVDMLRAEYGWDIRRPQHRPHQRQPDRLLLSVQPGRRRICGRQPQTHPPAPGARIHRLRRRRHRRIALHVTQAADRIPGRSSLQVPRRLRRTRDHRRHRRHLRLAADQPHRQRADRRRRSTTSAAWPRRTDIPLIVDNAYGAPFPHIIFTEATPHWEPHKILCMSLSKLGMPGARTGIVVAREEIVQALTGMNAVVSLAPNGFGSALAVDAVRTREHSRPEPERHQAPLLAQGAARRRLRCARRSTARTTIFTSPRGRSSCGSGCAICPSRARSYTTVSKQRGVVVVPGHYFFPGLDDGVAAPPRMHPRQLRRPG